MAEKKYKIKVQGQLIEVSKDVYLAFYQMRRQEQAQRERDAYNHCIQYAALDSEGLLGEDILLDQNALSVEEQAISAILTEKLPVLFIFSVVKLFQRGYCSENLSCILFCQR